MKKFVLEQIWKCMCINPSYNIIHNAENVEHKNINNNLEGLSDLKLFLEVKKLDTGS